jgi:tetrapyrrole methylase family protein/MazG family protein
MCKVYNNLKKTIKKLRGPKGCPWDKKQTHKTLIKYLKSEVEEFIECQQNNDYEGMKEELGDILLQIFMHAQIASENKKFNIDDVFKTLNKKLVRRHPHVFNKTKINSINDIIINWEKIKQEEILEKRGGVS